MYSKIGFILKHQLLIQYIPALIKLIYHKDLFFSIQYDNIPKIGYIVPHTGSFLLRAGKLLALESSKYHFLMLVLDLEET